MDPSLGLDATQVAVFALAATALFAVVYVWTAIGLARVFVKLGESSSRAWVPVLNIVTLLRLGEVNPAVVLFLVVPVVQVIGIVFFVTAVNTVNKRFGLGPGMTVLAFFAFPAWASVLGFGPRVPIGGVPGEWRTSETAPVVTSVADGPVWAPYIAEPVVVSNRAAAPSTLPPVFVPTPARVLTPAPAPRPVAVAPTPDPWAPPPLVRPAPEPEAIPRVPSPDTVPSVAAGVEASAPAHDLPADFDQTVVGQRHRTPSWYVIVDGSPRVKLTTNTVLLGRNPSSRADYPSAQLVSVADPDKTVSKTHAHLALADGRWTITDLDSTNGVYLVSALGTETEIDIGVPADAGESFRLGDLLVTLSKEG